MINKNDINYMGPLNPEDVSFTFSKYHVYLFPSGGENYGYTIVESLLQGIPILLSDKTPWNKLSQKGWGWNISLTKINDFIKILHKNYNSLISNNYFDRKKIRKSFIKELKVEELVNNYLKIFINE